MQTLDRFLEENTHTSESLTLTPETRAFLAELFRRLGETLKPGKAPGVEARQRFIEAHLGAPHTGQTIVSRHYPRPASNQVLVALDDVLHTQPYQTDPTVDYDDDEGQRAPRYRSVPVSPSESRAVLEEGYYPAYYAVERVPLVVGVAQRDELVVWVHSRAVDRDLAAKFFEQVDDQPKLYLGQVIKLTPEGYPQFMSVPEARFHQDVILDPTVQSEIERHVLRFSERETAYRAAGLPFRRGLILAGPPGVGKTQIFRALTHELGGRYTVVWVTSGTISWECTVSDVFTFARALRPTLLLWEDLDLTVQDRAPGRSTRELGELLAQLDGAESAEGMITCASTNDVSALDKALSARPSRFDCVLHLAPPGLAARLRMLRRFASGIEHLEADLDLVAERTDGYTGAYLKELVVGAFTCALDEADDAHAPTVSTHHFLQALEQLDRRVTGPDRWRTVLGAASR
jgi:ATP-dependent 26S proteasome regulatory subunit